MVHEHCILAFMQYRKLQAGKIFNGFNWLNDGQVVIVDENSTIQNIVSKDEAGEGIERFEGVLAPGLVNCHCHLELSHLKNVVPPNTGLVNFLLAVIKKRAASEKEILKHIEAAEQEMFDNGIVAVADVCNTNHSIDVKRQNRIHFHNLIEVINLYDENLDNQLLHFNHLLEAFKGLDAPKGSTSLAPHAPYSVSNGTFKAINNATINDLISIHNQEAFEENEVFEKGQGDFLRLYEALGVPSLPVEISGKTSLQTWLPHFTNGQTLILVHNTFISEEDILFAKTHEEKYGIELIYCVCPNANLYIENKLPPIDLLLKHNCKMVIGTDSYSSNWQLNIASEIKTLCTHFPKLELETVLGWATINGAEALRQNSFLGSLEKGKKPGIVLLETDSLNIDSITGKSRRII